MPTEERSALVFLMDTPQKWASDKAQAEVEIQWFL
jgi:hypothetical protein